jgi:riboflavin biosynthesis pyrimidine reductase
MVPLELLYESSRPARALPAELARLYGGDLELPRRCLYANFVASLDGVVTLRQAEESGRTISGGNEADRFVMALLRAHADAVMIGAGTFRKAPGHRWHAETLVPGLSAAFAELRGGRPPPPLVLVTESGEIDAAHPALDDARILTTAKGEARLRGALPAGARLIVCGDERISMQEIRARLDDEGFLTVLTEGGPSLVAELVHERLLDQLFLTRAPSVFGRFEGDGRKGVFDGCDLSGARGELLGVRRHESFLFLRYGFAARRGASR